MKQFKTNIGTITEYYSGFEADFCEFLKSPKDYYIDHFATLFAHRHILDFQAILFTAEFLEDGIVTIKHITRGITAESSISFDISDIEGWTVDNNTCSMSIEFNNGICITLSI